MVQKRICMIMAALLLFAAAGVAAAELTPKEQLGKSLFFDTDLSINQNQACAACHGPEVGWTGPDSQINKHGAVYEGSISGRFGNRKPPSSAYATNSPILHYEKGGGGLFVGGNFWDGRATGEKLGNPAADQAQGPFLNPLEQGLRDGACVVYRVSKSVYYSLYQQVWDDIGIDWSSYNIEALCAIEGPMLGLTPVDRAKSDKAYNNIALSIAAYEASPEVNAFTSKYDAVVTGREKFTKKEQEGFNLFWGKGKCNKCHTVNPRGKQALFTDYTYDNLGIPRNPENPFYTQDEAWIDFGLGGFLQTRMDYSMFARENYGKHKVPTLRNVAKGSCEAEPGNLDCIDKAYGHNGYFKRLKEIVHFYNTRDVLPVCNPGNPDHIEKVNCWPLPEIALNMNTKELGDLGLSPEEEDALVAFMMALSDGYIS